ncbi:MAG: efflux RND transporter periplasmic adaptor subunit [Pseudomonadota bacterium]
MRRATTLAAAAGLFLATAGLDLPGCEDPDAGEIVAYGAVEATEVRVASLLGGAVLEVGAAEGDAVQAGQVLVRTDVRDLELQRAQIEAQLKAAQAQERMARRGARREDVQGAEQALAQAHLQVQAGERDLARTQALLAKGAVTPKQLDDAASMRDLALAREAQAQSVVEKLRRGARAEEIEAATAMREQAEAALAMLDKKITDAVVTSPLAGRVLSRLVEPGEVARPGGPLLVLADLRQVHVDVYLAEQDLGLVQLSQAVQVHVDALPGAPRPGHVASISDRAEFTPKNVQTAEQRARLVFKIRIQLANDDEKLKPGMPARVVFGPRPAATP